MRVHPNIFVTHLSPKEKGTISFLEDAALEHLRSTTTHPEIRVQGLGHRKFDHFTISSAMNIAASYLANVLNFSSNRPYYIFEVGRVEIGRYATASTLRGVSTNRSALSFFLQYHINLVRCAFVLGAAKRLSRNTVGLYLGNVYYLDGIVVDFFLQRQKVSVYLNLPEPDDLLCIKGNYDNIRALQQHLSERKHAANTTLSEAADYMKDRLRDPKGLIHYYRPGEVVSEAFAASKGKIAVIVYAHAFTDAQLPYGFDGFKGVYEWLSFTINELVDNNEEFDVYLKAHPNFFGGPDTSGTVEMDRLLWKDFAKQTCPKIRLVNDSTSNFELLRGFDPSNTILISHHGNAVVEGASMGFSVISSSASPWGRQYKFARTWSSKDDYQLILSRVTSHARRQTDVGIHSALNYAGANYMNHEPWINLVARYLSMSLQDLHSDPFRDFGLSGRARETLITQLASRFEVIV